MRHLRYKLVEVCHRLVDVYFMSPVALLYMRTAQGSTCHDRV